MSANVHVVGLWYCHPLCIDTKYYANNGSYIIYISLMETDITDPETRVLDDNLCKICYYIDSLV